MNMLIIRIKVLHTYRRMHKSQVYRSVNYHKVNINKPVQEIVHDQHPETTLEFPLCPPQT